jgi:hypothetical protein
MPIDILAEAEAVAAARWRATEVAPEQEAPEPRPAATPGGIASEQTEPWLVRHALRLDERLLSVVMVLAVMLLVSTTALTALSLR